MKRGRHRRVAARGASRSCPVLLGCIALLLRPAAGAADPCPAEPGPRYEVEVAIDVPPPRLRHDLGRAELGEMAFHGTDQRVLGLTTSRAEVLLDTEVRGRKTGDGLCLWVARIEATLRYSGLDIFIASEYAPTSCPYKAILAHERRHAKVARSHLRGYVEPVRSALSALAIPRAGAPIRVASPEEGEAHVKALLARLLAPLREELSANMRRAQARVDTREAYRRVRRQCRDW